MTDDTPYQWKANDLVQWSTNQGTLAKGKVISIHTVFLWAKVQTEDGKRWWINLERLSLQAVTPSMQE